MNYDFRTDIAGVGIFLTLLLTEVACRHGQQRFMGCGFHCCYHALDADIGVGEFFFLRDQANACAR